MTKQTHIISNKIIKLLNDTVVAFDATKTSSYQKIGDLIGNARIVLMGEATHGTTEFYQVRMKLSKYLIQEKGFQAIAIEGDWTSAYPIHHYCQGIGRIDDAKEALNSFVRFPRWMWYNTDMVEFIQQLRQYNDNYKDKSDKIGFYGLDLYCLTEAAQAVINYLEQHDPEAAKKAAKRYACFDHAHIDPQLYGYAVEKKLKKSCSADVTTQLIEAYYLAYQKLNIENDLDSKEQQFYMTQNARVVKNAENYYRAMFEANQNTWNIRDQHMADTLQNIMSHLETLTNKPAKVIVWAHNSHIGDARATEMSERQEVNLGQLVRERFNTTSFSLGFSTAVGVVTAASKWGGKAEYKLINSPLKGSYEWLFHQLNEKNFLVNLREKNYVTELLKLSHLQRAIGVIYSPETERMSHYYFSHLSYQFDALIHFDQTQGLTPLK
ncbi:MULTISPECIES: erythromycin esterase family protein [Francisella]|uniref:Erythromycin esterase family protein n=1 Tax=Francisella opportunistica TaxID=2016517 RepID=A0A345JSJ1_9GAMM|nr:MULTISPECIES: erythromycin esterase family protein [Francisella]APC92057.1 Protein-L-isoaspartate O-methyltransferase [Francisella sp. MA067296]AXH30287.1 erythromycin esterase family protein [Francisella opportunistica]AXH31928.1 erythromycin esterase [Francisella opportunistica]AXH33574.1 erythromycin esterase [Francisella opportunistica]